MFGVSVRAAGNWDCFCHLTNQLVSIRRHPGQAQPVGFSGKSESKVTEAEKLHRIS